MAPPAYSAGRGVCSNIRGIASGTSTYVGPILSVLPPSMGGLSFFAPFFLLLPLLSRLSPFFPRVFSSPLRLATVIRVVRVVIGRRTPSPLPARSPRRCVRIVALVPPTATPARLTIPASTYIVPRRRRSFARSLDALCRRFATSEKTAPKAFKKLLTHLEYRDRHRIHGLALLPAKRVFNNHEAQMAYNRMMPHGILGRDYKGQPVLYKHIGRLNLGHLTKLGADLPTTLRYNEWLTERLGYALGHIGQWTIVVDVSGITTASCAPYSLTNSEPLRREFCMMSLARYTYSSRRSGMARNTSLDQMSADSLTAFLWNCTQWESVWMDCWLSESFSSLLRYDVAEKPPAILVRG